MVADQPRAEVTEFVKHVQGASFTRHSNFVKCSCGWQLATDNSSHGEWARARFNEHVIDAIQDALVAASPSVPSGGDTLGETSTAESVHVGPEVNGS